LKFPTALLYQRLNLDNPDIEELKKNFERIIMISQTSSDLLDQAFSSVQMKSLAEVLFYTVIYLVLRSSIY